MVPAFLTAGAARHLLLPLLLLTLPAVVQAEDFTYTTNNGAITITGYIGTNADVTIPDTITGLPVVSIGDAAFAGSGRMIAVTIGNNVTNIGNHAFRSTDGSGRYLQSVTIQDSVTRIGDYAFYYCTSLTNMTIGKGVSVIGTGVFRGCLSLKAITVDPLNSHFSTPDGVLFDKAQTALIQYPGGKAGDYAVPGGVVTLGYAAFRESGVTSVVLPDSVISIGDYAFAYCYHLTNATIGNSVFSIGSNAFVGCIGLTRTMIGNSVTNIGTWAFSGCSSLTGIYFRGNAPTLGGSQAFSDAYGGTVYYLPGRTGWGETYGGRPTALWQPQVPTTDGTFGVHTNHFGFNIAWASGMTAVVEASTDLAIPTWLPLQTNTLPADTLYFSDPDWTNSARRFYRIRWP